MKPSLSANVELLGRAFALAPVLRSRASEAEKLRRLPKQSVAELKQAGMFTVLRARRHGGAQQSLSSFVDVVAALGKEIGRASCRERV